ncbi:CYTH domain-containing protein [Neorhizobium galegae]|uniref:CYTH domain-containing protein n=1 Tax=Neorhizobium galegae TaxID=399 RepID=A0A6A1TVG0_NEOGA|nr:CYTH domain-containing protein [Neorhizobium galegae]KAB1088025.1 CYTH domain-containing protein [Neorhizobium galegae]
MAKEIERKFLVKSDGWRSEVSSSSDFLQAYVASGDDRSVRVRIMDGKRAKLTIKIGRELLARDEFEYEIPLADAEEMANAAVGIVLEKTRHEVRHGGYTWEVDVYDGAYKGLVVAEVEIEDEGALPDIPDWIGGEITGDRRYSNMVMATEDLSGELCHGVPSAAR